MTYENGAKVDLPMPANTGGPQGADIATPMKDVEGKVAFVTGGVSGIGLGIARALLNAGMKVVITYRSKHHLDEAMATLKNAGDRLHALNLDVADRAAVDAAAHETVRVFGKVHVLINNAGVALMLPLSNATFDDWDWCMRVNVDGVFNGIRAFLPHIRAHGEGGQIVATSSMLGGVIVGPYWGVYSASKFAVTGMMEALRAELENTNIGVSVFCPAGVYSNASASDRNRPGDLAEAGTPDPHTKALMEGFRNKLRDVVENEPEPAMDANEAGERVLRGIRNNDLYILSHAEYEQAIRDRCEALLAAVPRDGKAVSKGRIAISEMVRNPIYINELKRRSSAQTCSQ